MNEHRAETISRTLSDWKSLETQKCMSDIVRVKSDIVGGTGHCPVGGLWKTRFSLKICPFLPNIDS
jgi:hypothetical protein